MSALALDSRPTYLNVASSLKSWLLTTDHKRIGILYMISVTVMFFVGAIFAGVIRAELISPVSWLVQPATYNKMFTMHGVTMVWFFLIPSIPAVLGNFLLPLMVGARDVAFPKLNLLSWYIYMLGVLVLLYVVLTGGVDTGWTFYTPYSTSGSNTHVLGTTLGVFIVGFSSILTGMNFIVTTHKMRAPGLTWGRLPLFVWSLYATSLILVLATPILAITLLLIAAERVLHVGIFDPALGGDPILFQHLFWFYSHPAVYIMILPGMGVVSEIIPTFSRNRPFGYKFVAGSSLAIAIFGFLVWGHHLFVAGQSIHASLVFSGLSYAVAIPSAVKVFNWSLTMRDGSISLKAPMLYAIGFIGLFVIGGLTGLWLAALAFDAHVHDTYFVIGHFHYIMVGGMVMAYIGGIHFWFPKITGRMYPERLGQLAAIITFVGFNLTFFPQLILGVQGMPRRYAVYPPEYQLLNIVSSAGALVLGVGYILPLLYLIPSIWRGKRATNNPWGATGLEWTTSSPPPPENFYEVPCVEHEAYDFEAIRDVILTEAE